MDAARAYPDPTSDPDVRDQSEAWVRLHGICRTHGDDIVAAWLDGVPVEDRIRYPDLGRQLGRVLVGLCDVFENEDWARLQSVIQDLATRHAHSDLKLERGLQRTLLDLRHAMRPYLAGDAECEELLLATLNECVLRFFEAYQGVRVASETDRLHTRIIQSLVTALEARDPYTKGHSLSVALLARKIAASSGGFADPAHAYLAGLLHDVGKVGIPDDILSKPRALDQGEWGIMRQHPAVGAKILRPIKLYPDIIEAVLAHHENLDGSGYPSGLAGAEIPPIARIIRVVDSFDAMTSARIFRVSMPVEQAIAELHRLGGTIYDQDVVSHLERIVGSEGTMRELSLATLQLDLIS